MMQPNIKSRLSTMMFLQYAVWGAWLPLAARYLAADPSQGGLGFTGAQIGMILGLAGSVGAAVAPFLAGQVADRYFRTERCLAVLLFTGGIIIWCIAYQKSYSAWLILSILYSVVYMPTLALSNSMAFAHLEDQKRDFPMVRVWGTLGWIAASWVFPMIWLQTGLHLQWMPPFVVGDEVPQVTARLVDALKFSGLMSFGYAAFCLFLPTTPPKRDAREPLAFAKAFALFRWPSFTLLVVASLAVSVIHQIYFLQTAPFLSSLGIRDSDIGPVMTIGQFAEIAVMAILGRMLVSLGFRKIMVVGILAYFARYAVFGSSEMLPVWAVVSSQALHGFCYACFFAGSYIYVDRLAEEDVRHSAQTVYGIIILGGGPILGGWLSGWLQKACTSDVGVFNYSPFWYTCAVIGLVTAIVFGVFFRDQTAKEA